MKNLNLLILLCSLFAANINAKSNNSADTLKVHALIDSALVLKKMNLPDAEDVFELAIEKAEKLELNDWKIKAGYQKFLFLYQRFQYDRAALFADTLITWAEESYDQKALAEIYLYLGEGALATRKFDLVENYIGIAEKIYNKQNDKLGIAKVLLARSASFVGKQEMIKGLQVLYDAEDILISTGNKRKLAEVYNNIGTLNIQLGYYEDAKRYLEKAVENITAIKDTLALIYYATNLANTYTEINTLKHLAEEKYLEVYKISQDYKYFTDNATILMTLGDLAEERGDYLKALEYYNEALTNNEDNISEHRKMTLYIKIGKIKYDYLREYLEAESYLKRALTLAEKLNNQIIKSSIFFHFYELYKTTGNSSKALANLESYNSIQDSINAKTKTDEYLEISKKYEAEKKDKEILQLEFQNTSQKYTITTLVALLLFLFIIVLVLVFRRKQMKMKKQAVDLKNQNLEIQIESTNKELAQKALYIAHMQENRNKIAGDIKTLIENPTQDLNKTLRTFVHKIESDSNNSNSWKEFDEKFNEINSEFSKKLIVLYPDLTPVELRVVSLLKLKLSTKEIAEIFNRSPRTIENTRKSIRKKMNLNHNQNLTTHISGL